MVEAGPPGKKPGPLPESGTRHPLLGKMAVKCGRAEARRDPAGDSSVDALQPVNARSNSQTKVNRFTAWPLPLLISSYYGALSHARRFPCKVLQRKMEDFLSKRQSRSLCLPSTGSSESGSTSANISLN